MVGVLPRGKSTVRRLTVRTVHIWMVNIFVCGSTVVGEIFVGSQLLVNTSRGVCMSVCSSLVRFWLWLSFEKLKSDHNQTWIKDAREVPSRDVTGIKPYSWISNHILLSG